MQFPPAIAVTFSSETSKVLLAGQTNNMVSDA
jgi:hypothetical protein